MPELSDEEVDKVVRQMALIHLTDPEMGQYHDAVIDDFNRTRVEAHLLHCSNCKERYETMKHILATCHEVEVPEESLQQLRSLMAQTESLGERLRSFASRLSGLINSKPESEKAGQMQLWLMGFELGINGGVSGLDRLMMRNFETLAVQGADEKFRFLTVFEEDEATGELYLFMGAYGEKSGPVSCWSVGEGLVELSFVPVKTGRLRYRAYLTDGEVLYPEKVHPDLEINTEERREERKQLLEIFLEALESGAVEYRAVEQEVAL